MNKSLAQDVLPDKLDLASKFACRIAPKREASGTSVRDVASAYSFNKQSERSSEMGIMRPFRSKPVGKAAMGFSSFAQNLPREGQSLVDRENMEESKHQQSLSDDSVSLGFDKSLRFHSNAKQLPVQVNSLGSRLSPRRLADLCEVKEDIELESPAPRQRAHNQSEQD